MVKAKPVVAILDSLRASREMLVELVREQGNIALPMEDGSQLAVVAGSTRFSLVVINAGSNRTLMVSIFRQLAGALVSCPVLVILDQGDVEGAVLAMRLRAVDVMTAPIDPIDFKQRVAKQRIVPELGSFVCQDGRTRQLLALSDRVAQTDVTVLISGDSGTGKEVLAKHIHLASPRSSASFVAVNCASIPETMLEDMLFGHEKGAFTGAHQRHQGLFEQAQKGTLFLDEVGELPIPLQAKLLRVLQERELKRLGGTQVISIDTRIVAATNKNLAQEVEARNFREDLYYRLNVFPLRLTPLRERVEDILPIAQALLRKHQQRMGMECVFSTEAENFLKRYSWPGNVRELENVVQRALVLAVGSVIDIDHLLVDQVMSGGNSNALDHPASSHDLARGVVDDRGLNGAAQDNEQKIILDTLSRVNGSRKHAAEKLNISPRTLRYKLAKLRDQGVVIPQGVNAGC